MTKVLDKEFMELVLMEIELYTCSMDEKEQLTRQLTGLTLPEFQRKLEEIHGK